MAHRLSLLSFKLAGIMSLAVLKSRALAGMEAPEVTVEVHLGRGLPSFAIVGLADTEVKEARERVRAAIQNARFEFPASRTYKSHPYGQDKQVTL